MKIKFNLPAAAITLALLFNLNVQISGLAQGSLTPPGAPGATMLTLSQIEPRTPISSVPFTITQRGSYYLTTNLVCSVSNAITITVSDVTLDLSGFTISSTVANAVNGGTAILFNSSLRNITIANGFIQGGVTNNGSGVYSGSGFGYGIYFSLNSPMNVLVSRVSISGCLNYGIFLNNGDSAVVESCTVRTIGGYGIVASTVKQSSAIDCGSVAVLGDQVSDCRGESSGSGDGVYGVDSVQNCFGSSSSGYGLSGYCIQNCYGDSTSSEGLSADVALNCYGFSNTGDGIYCYLAQNCLGSSNGSSDGINAYYIANGCYGYSYTGPGIAANIANSCYSSSGDGFILHPYNMP